MKRLTRHIARVPFEGGKGRGGRGGPFLLVVQGYGVQPALCFAK